jgi:hypothetical protein
MIRRQIVQDHPEANAEVNAVLLDFLLYDLAKEFESTGTFCACGGFSCTFPLDTCRLQNRRPMNTEHRRLHKQAELVADIYTGTESIPHHRTRSIWY